jgi:hypothetical protein
VVWQLKLVPNLMAREPKTLANSDRTNATLVILSLLQLGSLVLPKRLLILLGQISEELEEVSQKLSFIRVIEISLRLALVRLLLVIDRECLVADCCNSTDLPFADVEDLGGS